MPKLIPEVTPQVWDTKAQVTKAATHALLTTCKTCKNPDVLPAIPAVVTAISKPSETNKAVQELMSTTFVAAVDAPTLAILCPVLARALKEKLALHKRAACIVIKNMSRLVESPTAVAPFGPLLVPELKKVANNVQFEEIRDEALKALSNLTKALGDSYEDEDGDEGGGGGKEEMEKENARVAAEQKRIEEERAAELKKETALRKKEAEERAKFKEAMEAQRLLDKMADEDAEKKKIEAMKKKDQAARSTKGASGKCQACGLKKCKKTCVYYEK
uniref:TOG domain-containing protein n=1 Tax=Cyclophora tenuis TaxID=216820 RepID=A0A7S1GLC0_CYCTE